MIQEKKSLNEPSQQNKSYLIAYLALIFFGWLGVHRYYVGKWKSGFLYMITLGFFGYGILYDYYFYNKPKNVLFYPIIGTVTLIFSKAARAELRLYLWMNT